MEDKLVAARGLGRRPGREVGAVVTEPQSHQAGSGMGTVQYLDCGGGYKNQTGQTVQN